MSITVQEIKAELDEYVKKNTSVISAGVYSDNVQIDQYCKKISAVKGKYPQFHKILTRVVQGFKAEWQSMGAAEFKAKVLQNYRQKVNFSIIPDEVYATWLSDLKIEGKTPKDQPIAKQIVDELMEKIIDDCDDLAITGVRDDANADGQFGKSIDGVAELITKGLAHATYPMFKVPLNTITTANRLDEMEKYERGIPAKVRNKVKRIFVSENFLYEYKKAMLDTYGANSNFADGKMDKTIIGNKQLVGLRGLPDNVIFSTIDGNMVKLIDVLDNPPRITDTQVQDYELKLFLEFHLGYDFIMNHLVFVAVFDGSLRGFDDADLNTRYYESEALSVTP